MNFMIILSVPLPCAVTKQVTWLLMTATISVETSISTINSIDYKTVHIFAFVKSVRVTSKERPGVRVKTASETRERR